uniref:leukemia NUP98 fusion partner 1 isoform X2 n=1 Tax=Doryrhamphus excisus TaxID=161450 RepID=UPI0025AE66C9|nr:leukemia NUP98 fusion partner 1 isoform X2 [Doryrhamphus excisus]
MSLRLLPAIIMDNDEDDDGNFTKWMSSYWGHGAEGRQSRDRKRSFNRPARTKVDRRASLPTVSQLDAMKLNRLHAATMASAPSHLKSREDKGEVRPHPRARRASSDGNGRSKSAVPENRISTIPELTESFEKRLCLRDKRTISLNDDDNLCVICHDNMCKSGGAVQELHCAHAFHKEVQLLLFMITILIEVTPFTVPLYHHLHFYLLYCHVYYNHMAVIPGVKTLESSFKLLVQKHWSR